MTLKTSDFGAFHAAVHEGKQPFAWQQRLLKKIVDDKAWPRVLDLPTGVGKTTCVDIALFALALDAENNDEQRWCPRRIVMIVDRRIVVDQVAERGRKLLSALKTSADAVVVEVARRLRCLTREVEEPLGVFTLRGGMPKDDGWARTPDQPLVIASTVDQVGSRMFMQGYGVSQGMKPVHAGLLANDTLLLLDEVHLSEPFRQTLDQLARLRNRFASSGLKPRFMHAFLSATPGAGEATPFTLTDDEKASDSPLGPRLHASKPVRLVEVHDRPALQNACVEEAKALLERHRTIAVIVNRVASAGGIARQLTELLRSEARVTLLTGRMRPLDRDDVLRELRPAVQTGRERSADGPKRVIVGTQCLEAGADFDFDALVTEAASLDSLRQRFGRVDRLGEYRNAEGVIVHDKSTKDDPVYGNAIVETIRWFKEQEKERSKKLKDELRRLKNEAMKLRGEEKARAEAHIARRNQVDFGVLALDVPTGDDLRKLLAPKPNAPTLLPAYLDLWAQTSPTPSQLPDVSLWLHGPQSAPPDVQVIWRADLTEEMLRGGDVDAATAIVSAVRPSGLEAVSLPYAVARAWLANASVDDCSDAEGATSGTDDSDSLLAGGRPALCWRGDESDIVNAGKLRPGVTIIVPCAYGGIRNDCFDPEAGEPVTDRAEQAALFSRAQPVLRLHPHVTAALGLAVSIDEPEQAREELRRLASTAGWPDWKRVWAERLADGQDAFAVPGDPGWAVLAAKRVPIDKLRLQAGDSFENGVETTTDADDSFWTSRSVTLSEHSRDVESFARKYATRSGLGPWLTEHLACAAWLHDIGKADPRFQRMLRGGSEIEYFKDETPWAKSSLPSGAQAAHRLAQQRSGYPRGARHEVQSAAMIQANRSAVEQQLKQRLNDVSALAPPDLDLVLHLVASHHGHCRPLAPPVVDAAPVEVSLEGHCGDKFEAIHFAKTSSDNGLHRLDAPLADRFWALVARYGWQELCWLEAILRLADHRASEDEQTRKTSP
jgi:CRISPR-associated endonuclease/helicase Cas3